MNLSGFGWTGSFFVYPLVLTVTSKTYIILMILKRGYFRDMIWILIIIFAVLLDQFTKYLVIMNIELGKSIKVIEEFFYLVHWRNKGAAWGIMQNGTLFFIIMTVIVSIILAVYMYKNDNKVLRLAISMILGGAIGNLIDRVLRPEGVVDFLNFYIFSYNFPAFNIADSFITVGTAILAIYIFFIYKEDEGHNSL